MPFKSKLYLFTVVIILLLLFKQSLNSQLSDKLDTFANILNHSGRQRMLSQNITKNALKLNEGEAQGKPLYEGRRKLKEMIASFEEVHYGLKERDEALGFGGTNSTYVKNMFDDIEPSFKVLKSNTDKLINSSQIQNLKIYTDVIINNNEAFLTRMNSIVNQYEEDFKSQNQSLSNLIFMLNAIIIIIFFLGMFYIIQEIT